jgi:hypothetical protein
MRNNGTLLLGAVTICALIVYFLVSESWDRPGPTTNATALVAPGEESQQSAIGSGVTQVSADSRRTQNPRSQTEESGAPIKFAQVTILIEAEDTEQSDSAMVALNGIALGQTTLFREEAAILGGRVTFRRTEPFKIYSVVFLGNLHLPKSSLVLGNELISLGEQATYTLPVPPGSQVFGRVIDPDGIPIASTVVRMDLAESEYERRLGGATLVRETRTNDRGEYSFTNTPGKFRLELADPLRVARSRFHIAGTPTALIGPINFQTTESTLYVGTVRDSHGEPVTGAMASANFDYGFGPGRWTPMVGVAREGIGNVKSHTDASGIVELLLPAGSQQTISLECEDFQSVTISVDGSDRTFDAVLERAPRLSGYILDSRRRPIENATIWASGLGWRGDTVRSNRKGEFSVVLAGEANEYSRVCAKSPGYRGVVVQPIGASLTKPKPLILTMDAESVVTGIVRNSDQSPAPGVRVEIRGGDTIHTPGRISGRTPTVEYELGLDRVLTDSLGRFQFEQVSRSEYELVVPGPSRTTDLARKRGSADSGQVVLQLQSADNRLQRVRVVLVDAGVVPAKVRWRPLRNTQLGWQSGTQVEALITNDEFVAPVPGDYDALLIEAAGWAPLIANMPAESSDLTPLQVGLRRGHFVEIELAGLDRRNGNTPTVVVEDLSGVLIPTYMAPELITWNPVIGLQGHIVMQGIPTGTYKLLLRSNDILCSRIFEVSPFSYLEPIRIGCGNKVEPKSATSSVAVYIENSTSGPTLEWLEATSERARRLLVTTGATRPANLAEFEVRINGDARLWAQWNTYSEGWNFRTPNSMSGLGPTILEGQQQLPVCTLGEVEPADRVTVQDASGATLSATTVPATKQAQYVLLVRL